VAASSANTVWGQVCEALGFILLLVGIEQLVSKEWVRGSVFTFLGPIAYYVGLKWSNVHILSHLPRLKIVWPSERSRSSGVSADVVNGVQAKLEASELELRSAKNSIHALEMELGFERKKLAMMQLEKLGRSQARTVTVRFIDYSDADQADAIKNLLQGIAGWIGTTVRDEGSTARRWGPHRIECASGNPEIAKAVAGALNHGVLLGEWVDEREIIDSADENLIFTIFPRASMAPPLSGAG
jgi:hypothetical protein